MLTNADVVASKAYFSEVSTQATNLNDLLRWRARHQAQRQAFTFLEHGEERERWTYADLEVERLLGRLPNEGKASDE